MTTSPDLASVPVVARFAGVLRFLLVGIPGFSIRLRLRLGVVPVVTRGEPGKAGGDAAWCSDNKARLGVDGAVPDLVAAQPVVAPHEEQLLGIARNHLDSWLYHHKGRTWWHRNAEFNSQGDLGGGLCGKQGN